MAIGCWPSYGTSRRDGGCKGRSEVAYRSVFVTLGVGQVMGLRDGGCKGPSEVACMSLLSLIGCWPCHGATRPGVMAWKAPERAGDVALIEQGLPAGFGRRS